MATKLSQGSLGNGDNNKMCVNIYCNFSFQTYSVILMPVPVMGKTWFIQDVRSDYWSGALAVFSDQNSDRPSTCAEKNKLQGKSCEIILPNHFNTHVVTEVAGGE